MEAITETRPEEDEESSSGSEENGELGNYVEPETTTLTPGDGSQLSKNQLKRMRRAEKLEEYKKQKKIAEKERRKASKRRKQEEILEKKRLQDGDGTAVSDAKAAACSAENPIGLLSEEERIQLRQDRKLKAKADFAMQCDSRFTVVIDCDFESCHTERPLKSLSQQLAFCYGFNRRAANPVHIYYTGLGPKLRAQLAKSHCEGWVGVQMTDQCYTQLQEFYISDEVTQQQSIDIEKGISSGRRKQLVYLTADAEETITEFDNNCAYIIGGIVDRNRYKGITHKKAVSQGLRTAKLPIKEHVSMVGTPVLTVNHVFEIMLLFDQNHCWKTTLNTVLPQRKDHKLRGSEANGDQEESEEGDEYNAIDREENVENTDEKDTCILEK